jgi:hypothetical protein
LSAAIPRTIVLDVQRLIANIPWDDPAGHEQLLRSILRSLPSVDNSAGVPLWAPVLIVQRVLDVSLCNFLVALYDKRRGSESRFLLDGAGAKMRTMIDHRLKHARADRARLRPAVDRFFRFKAMRMDCALVSCYALSGGHFHRHWENVNAGAQHWRFAHSLNLNNDYEGCNLLFRIRPPELAAARRARSSSLCRFSTARRTQSCARQIMLGSMRQTQYTEGRYRLFSGSVAA